MHSTTSTSQKKCTLMGLEVRYERSFLVDLKRLEQAARKPVQTFVFEDFFTLNQLHDLPEFRPLGSSGILYRFSFENCLISLEIMGQIVKFLRVLPKSDMKG
ncbi:cytotoxic translational repressor of toxin-antitoxin stability system [Kovacikia minuta CCNUW1]|uniref:cytotoxic translational repressor of toxin-antitoxin stability system n=1 Tax=Kovacikia minuta TaxID=2931930 RepID=UPI001CCD0646|nr:cytotoxic translational repressor of toxin-antitoxin stability system [Kovacikia minuta]UBF27416.1 cytotoxic translational repressor of toxin-antitoxin stability system [Kovacikia minuta CCNUW1]